MSSQEAIILRPTFGKVVEIDARLASSWSESGKALLLDVREPEELEIEWIPGATAMPLSKFDPAVVAEMETQAVMVICHTGRRSREAAERLIAHGISDVYNIKDGLLAWNAADLPSVDQSALLI